MCFCNMIRTKRLFVLPNRYTFSNKNGLTIGIINFGAYIKDVLVPDKNGKCEDINLGFDDLEGRCYVPCHGCIRWGSGGGVLM